jgi:signal transduction histidine kinase/DNA-binding response OmpR family regulator
LTEPTPVFLPLARDSKPGSLSFLAAPGEMGQRIARFDWTGTPLGALRDWPQSLRTAVSLMLNSSHPMWIGWGPEATFLYNDAYISVLSAAKHPLALGRPAAVVWSEIWDFCGPLADKVFQKAEATFVDDVQLFMHRGSWIEETWYSFSYSPIVDESGGVGGLFCPSTDATSSNLNTRRLASLSALASTALREDSVTGACAMAMQTIARNPHDIPFAALYLVDEAAGTARLQQAVHLPPGDATTPATIALTGGAPTRWPVREVWRNGSGMTLDVSDLDALPLGLANQRLKQALALPLTMPGAERPIGVLLMGVSPARRLDDEYRTFFELVAGQVAAALQNAIGTEAQREHAAMLAELDRAKTAFFSNISHEFRTPLTLMLGPIEDALADAAHALAPVQRQRLELAHRNALRQQRLVNSLLDFSRVQAGRMQAVYAEVDLPALTRDLASGFRSIVESAGLAFNVRCAALSTPAWVDSALWEKIVLNLLSNAFKFTFEGQIEVQLEQHGGQAVLRVADSGVGIGAADLEHIFERFRRVEGTRARTHEGSGIGLALVRDLVELQHGSISVESTPSKGSCFTVTLPLGRAHLRDEQLRRHEGSTSSSASASTLLSYTAEAQRWLPESTAQQEQQVQAAPSPASAAADLHVLVADDNADMRAYLARLLSQRWRVTTAANGLEALQSARLHAPDLIVTDVMMPELDGFGLLAALRANPALHDTPVLMLSARAGEEARIEGMDAGADDYLVKPFSARELMSHVEAQAMRGRQRQAERQLASRVASVFHQAPVAIAILRGPGLVFEMHNERYAEIIKGRGVLGLPLRDALPELSGQGIYEELEQVLASGEPWLGSARRITLARGPNGEPEECFFDYVYQPMRNDSGTIERVAMVAFEVTELARARGAAEVANRAKDEFLAMLGHELRNPLSPILVALELMRIKGMAGLEKEHAVIERQARHLVRLVDDLLDVARITQGKIVLKREPLELGGLVARALETASSLLEERSHQLRVDVPATGLAINADAVRFTQVLSNLLTNAAKYTNRAGLITVSAYADGPEAVLCVSDNGIGISAEMLPRLFDKFTQEHQALDRSRGGLGLGLAIVRSLVALHHGTVRAFSAGQGQGSTFEVRMPLSAIPARDAAAAAAPRAAFGGKRIMLVDDNVDVLESLRALLELDGHEVYALPDPASALKLADTIRPDVAILDIGLPGMDGYELAAELRRHSGLAGTRMIALTGYGQPSDRQRTAAAGFSGHLVKPVNAEQLHQLLQAC